MEIKRPLSRGLAAAEMLADTYNESLKLEIYNGFLTRLKLAGNPTPQEIAEIEKQIKGNNEQIGRNNELLHYLDGIVKMESKQAQQAESNKA